MRVEIIVDTRAPGGAAIFPPAANYVDLRANPHAVEQIRSAREHLPLRNFLIAVNSAESVFQSVSASTQVTSVATLPDAGAFEFASEIYIAIAESPLRFAKETHSELAAALKDLLERDVTDAVRAVLRISPCRFADEDRDGFILGIVLIGSGTSVAQAETRWALGLARVQQALLFSARTIRLSGNRNSE